MKNFLMGFFLFFSISSFADELYCTASEILVEGTVEKGEQIIFNTDRTFLNNQTECDHAPDFMAHEIQASLIIGCGSDEPKDIFIFSEDSRVVAQDGVAIYSCESEGAF